MTARHRLVRDRGVTPGPKAGALSFGRRARTSREADRDAARQTPSTTERFTA